MRALTHARRLAHDDHDAASHAKSGGVSVEAIMTSGEMTDGLAFCAEKYQVTYSSHWIAEPDVLFVARKEDSIVATAALELGSKRSRIDSERYFLLSPGMRSFIEGNRRHLVEFGRFASDDPAGTRAVIHAAITFTRQSGGEFFFAWANPAVYTYVRDDIGLPLSVIDVPVNEAAVRADTSWTTPPVKFFIREDAPRLLIGVMPFLDIANARLAAAYGPPLSFLL